MGKFNGKDATVWMRGLRPHTYEGKAQDEGSIYLAHEEMVETIEILKMAVREAPPKRAVRPTEATPNQPQTAVAGPVVEPLTVETAPALVPSAARRGRPPKQTP